MNYDWLQTENNALIYIGDTMCSWCYGIAPELAKIKNNHPEIEFRTINGGLRPYNTEKAIDMADFLKSHWVEIEERTGQVFSHKILEDPNFVYDTEPASRAVIVARAMNPAIEFDFFAAVQTAFYRDNENTNELPTFIKIAKQFELDQNRFEELFHSQEIKESTKADFQVSQQMGIKNFPSLVLKKGAEFTLIAGGFETAENIEKTIEQLLV
jgi:putative protein-disulfide isomerase